LDSDAGADMEPDKWLSDDGDADDAYAYDNGDDTGAYGDNAGACGKDEDGVDDNNVFVRNNSLNNRLQRNDTTTYASKKEMDACLY